MVRALGLDVGASIAVTVEGGRMILTPTGPQYALADLLAGMKPGDMPTADGWDGAPAVGQEAW